MPIHQSGALYLIYSNECMTVRYMRTGLYDGRGLFLFSPIEAVLFWPPIRSEPKKLFSVAQTTLSPVKDVLRDMVRTESETAFAEIPITLDL